MEPNEYSSMMYLGMPKPLREAAVNVSGRNLKISLAGCFSRGVPAPPELILDLPDTVEILPTGDGYYADYSEEGALGGVIVSSSFIEIIETLEPTHHQTIRILNAINENGEPLPKHYFALNAARLAEAIDLSGGDIEIRQFANTKVYGVKQGLGRDPKIEIFREKISGRHFWRPPMGELGREFFCSTEFFDCWKSKQLRGLKFFDCVVMP